MSDNICAHCGVHFLDYHQCHTDPRGGEGGIIVADSKRPEVALHYQLTKIQEQLDRIEKLLVKP